MKTSQYALLIGLLLGAALAFGSFGQFFLVALFGVIGWAIGLVLDGRVEIRGVPNIWKG